MAKIMGNRNGLGAARPWEALGSLGGQGGPCNGPEIQRGTPGQPAPKNMLQEVPRDARAKTLGFRVSTFTPPWEGPLRGGSRPALPGLP